MPNMINPIRSPFNRDTRPLRAIMLTPRIHTMHDMPLLRGIEDRTLRIRQISNLLPGYRNRSVQVRKIVPFTVRRSAVELIGKFFIQALRWQPRDCQRREFAAARDSFGDGSAAAGAGDGLLFGLKGCDGPVCEEDETPGCAD